MTLQELREKSLSDLEQLHAKKSVELRELMFKASEAQLKEVHKVKAVRADIARILTVIREQDSHPHIAS
jgi:large subunit ribosomal protein L29